MKIAGPRRERTPGGARVVARVEWENEPGRSPLDVWWEAGGSAAEDLAASPDAILAAVFLPAAARGERRIALEGPVCPRLAEGLVAAARVFAGWGRIPSEPPRIEPRSGFRAPLPRRPERSALFLTGGIDSTHLLRRNRVDFPREHSESFGDALAVFGLYAPDQLDPADPFGAYARTREVLDAIAADAGLILVPVVTNATEVASDVDFIARVSLSSVLASAAHLFPSRWSSVCLASGRDASILVPLGTHPLIDPSFSSAAVAVRHEGIGITRPERIAELAAAEGALSRLLVCMAGPPPPFLNCGRCEKCLRTMAALAGLGRLAESREFPVRDLAPDAIDAFSVGPHYAPYWRDLLPLLRGRRDDLAAAVERQLAAAERQARWFRNAGWKGLLRRADRRFLGGRLLALRRSIARAS
ncbi:MAG TPA: hypothetical protein VFS34_17830 [Thermoanaerobaculia bacterium]|nr:hypothetical protein [Thermoanaerobaculia bacterium]